MLTIKDLQQITPYLWQIPQSMRKDMRVPARVYASKSMLEAILQEKALSQLINVATLPGIEKYALAMPDIHQGYGFPIGGVAALRAKDGVISPGGVGYDINCGVRLLASSYKAAEIKDQIDSLAGKIQSKVPSGVGSSGDLVLRGNDLDAVLNEGVAWALQNGYALNEDLAALEENGSYLAADASCVSKKAKQRGADQLGTLGAGNHFLEIQKVVEIYDEKVAQVFGLFPEQVTIMIHTGSRGLGHQVCTDHVRLMQQKSRQFDFQPQDRELICAPFDSPEGQNYFRAMAAAANFAWVNRQLITHQIRGAWQEVFGKAHAPLKIVYDVAHNIAKLEKHTQRISSCGEACAQSSSGMYIPVHEQRDKRTTKPQLERRRVYQGKELIVHRKGATRALAPGNPILPKQYQKVGQPIFIPGSMGTYSYVLAGTKKAEEETFASVCHGAGRAMSRMQAKKSVSYQQLLTELKDKEILVRAASIKGLVEEAPKAYKDIEEVVSIITQAGLAQKVARLKPIAIIKG